MCVWGGGDGIGTRGIRLQTNPKPQELDRVTKPWGKKLGTSSVFSKKNNLMACSRDFRQ